MAWYNMMMNTSLYPLVTRQFRGGRIAMVSFQGHSWNCPFGQTGCKDGQCPPEWHPSSARNVMRRPPGFQPDALVEFSPDPWMIFDIRAGGLGWMGLALGGVIALLVYAGLTDRSPLELLGLHYPLIAVTSIGLWLGAQLAGVGYGPNCSGCHGGRCRCWMLPATLLHGYPCR